jgi:DNA repair protein RadC
VTEFQSTQATQHSLWTHGIDEADGTHHSRVTVKHLRERLQQNGVSLLSNAELLSIVFGTGPSTPGILRQMQTLLGSMSLQELLSIDFGELSTTYVLGDVKAAQLQAVFEVARRLTLPTTLERYQIQSPADAANLVMADMSYLDHEELRVLCLDTKNRVVANIRLYQGTLNSAVLRAAEIFKPAVTRNCAGIIICHNHPTGDTTPSPEDVQTTQQLVAAAKLLDIDLVDHLIIGTNHRFVSLRDQMRW